MSPQFGESPSSDRYDAPILTSICVVPNQLFTKLSLLFLYRRLFWVRKGSMAWLWVIGVITVLWSISVYLVKWLMCSPVEYTWNKAILTGTCIDIPRFLAASETVNSVLDFVMIALALRIVSTLKMSIPEKIRLSVLFSVGSLYVSFSPSPGSCSLQYSNWQG